MEGKSFRNYAIGIGCLMLAGGLVFTVVWLSMRVLPITKSIGPAGPSIYSSCTPLKIDYALTVVADNSHGQEDLKDVSCEILLAGDLVADPRQQSIGDVIKGTSSHCLFSLRGDYEEPVLVRVRFNNGSVVTSSICTRLPPTQ